MIFDERELLGNFEGYPELARTIVEETIEAMPARFDALERAVLSGNWPEAHRLAHTAKGLASMVGGMRLSKELDEAERVLEDGGKITVTGIAELRRELALLTTALRRWLA